MDYTTWYSFAVTAGTTYYVWQNDERNSSETGWVNVNVLDSNGNTLVPDIDVRDEERSRNRFTASSSGTVRVRVGAVSSISYGTFAIAYTTTNTRP
jgi:hypothetical protein